MTTTAFAQSTKKPLNLDEARLMIANLLNAIDDKNEKIKAAQNLIDKLESENAKLEAVKEQAKVEIAKNEQVIEKKNTEIAEHQKQIGKYEAAIEALKVVAQVKDDEIARLKKERANQKKDERVCQFGAIGGAIGGAIYAGPIGAGAGAWLGCHAAKLAKKIFRF